MKYYILLFIFLNSNPLISQSKSELKRDLYWTDLNLKTAEENLVKAKLEVSKTRNELRRSNQRIIDLWPHLIIPEGFPEKFFPKKEKVRLYREMYSLGQEFRGKDSAIVSQRWVDLYSTKLNEYADTLLLLGIIDTTLYLNENNVLLGTVLTSYRGKFWFTTVFDLDGSKVISELEENQKYQLLTQEWGMEIANKLLSEQPWIGMNERHLKAMFGLPLKISSYETADALIYSHTYGSRKEFKTFSITLKNGVVTKIFTN